MITEASTTMASPRISFSTDFLDDDSFISMSPGSSIGDRDDLDLERSKIMKNNGLDFEFLSSKNSFDARQATMLTADELIFQGKLLPYCKINHAADEIESLTKINLKASSDENNNDDDNDNNNNPVCPNGTSLEEVNNNEKPQEIVPITKQANNGSTTTASGILLGREPQEPRIWFVDDDPSPRPPKCTVLWKELLRLKKQKSSTVPPSSSPSSPSSSTSSLGDAAVKDEVIQKEKEKQIKKIKKGGLERTRSSNSIRIRPMFNVPISIQTTTKSSSLPPLFPLRNNKIDG